MQKSRTYGFRFSKMDAIVLLVSTLVTIWLWQYIQDVSLLLVILVAHFFLFCNVFRIHRYLELLWSAVFFVNVWCWHTQNVYDWEKILFTQAPFTIIFISLEVFSSRYHGIFSKSVNPDIRRDYGQQG